MKLRDILLAILVVIIWGSNFVVIKIGLQDLPPILFTALRFTFVAIPLVFFIKRPAVSWRLLAGYGIFQFALQFTLLFSGINLGFPPGLASLVIQLQAFFTIGIAVLLLNERPRASQLLGALIAFSGMVLVALNLESQPTIIGFVLVVSAGLSWAVGNILTKKTGQVNPLALVVWGAFMASPPLWLASLLIEGSAAWVQSAQHFSWRSAAAVLFQSYPNTVLGYAIWALLMRKYPTATIAPFTLLVPVTGILCAVAILGEPLRWWEVAAGMLVLCGLMLNLFGTKLIMQVRNRKV